MVTIFVGMIPSQVGLANYLIPLMTGARDLAFPKLNAIASFGRSFFSIVVWVHHTVCQRYTKLDANPVYLV